MRSLYMAPLCLSLTLQCLSSLPPADQWAGGRLAANGKIYAFPDDSCEVLVIDPHANGAFCDSIVQSSYRQTH